MKNLKKLINKMLRIELNNYNKTISMMLKVSLSTRAKHQSEEHNNFRQFNKEEAVRNIKDVSFIPSVFFTLN